MGFKYVRGYETRDLGFNGHFFPKVQNSYGHSWLINIFFLYSGISLTCHLVQISCTIVIFPPQKKMMDRSQCALWKGMFGADSEHQLLITKVSMDLCLARGLHATAYKRDVVTHHCVSRVNELIQKWKKNTFCEFLYVPRKI